MVSDQDDDDSECLPLQQLAHWLFAGFQPEGEQHQPEGEQHQPEGEQHQPEDEQRQS